MGHASSGAGQNAASKASWVNDEDVSNCQGPGCARPFSYIWRRHHCRVCGGVFCDSCAPKDAIEVRATVYPVLYTVAAASLFQIQTQRLSSQRTLRGASRGVCCSARRLCVTDSLLCVLPALD